MPELDLVLLHAPSVYDFRQEAILYGPIADYSPAPYVLETCPLGYRTLAGYLEQSGHRVQLVNLAKHMLDDLDYDAEEAVAAFNPIAFGIDFHWLSHAQGTLAVAQIAKVLHPETPVILVGFAATYFHRELMNYPQVDYVLRGDSTEESLLYLLECVSLGRVPDQVPGLTWRAQSGSVVENPIGPPPISLDDLVFGDGNLSRTSRREYPATIGLMARGCTYSCLVCGGSAYASKRINEREAPGYRSPELLARDLHNTCRHRDDWAYVPCDITQPGMDYAYRFLQAMRSFPNLLYLDLLRPAPRKFLQDATNALPRLALQISMDSHDATLRQAAGKHYSNPAMEQTIADALALGCEQLDLYFTIGLPHQDYSSVMKTVDYCDHLMSQFGGGGRLRTFVAPLAPFLAPGSLAFEEPEKHGYRLLFRSLEDHRRALLAPTWKYVLNYETEWMTRDDIVRATYDAAIAIVRLRAKHHLLKSESVEAIETLVTQTLRLMDEIDRVLELDDKDQLQDTLRALKPEIDQINNSGPWNNGFSSLCRGGTDDQTAPTRHSDHLGRSLRVRQLLNRWWGRRHDSSERVAETNVHRPVPGPRQTGIF